MVGFWEDDSSQKKWHALVQARFFRHKPSVTPRTDSHLILRDKRADGGSEEACSSYRGSSKLPLKPFSALFDNLKPLFRNISV
jgi:hypothetical protein